MPHRAPFTRAAVTAVGAARLCLGALTERPGAISSTVAYISFGELWAEDAVVVDVVAWVVVGVPVVPLAVWVAVEDALFT